MKNLRDKKVLVTGGAQGIGYAVAECFAKEGADVFIGDIKIQNAEEAAKALHEKYGINTGAYMLDVSDRKSIASCFERFGRNRRFWIFWLITQGCRFVCLPSNLRKRSGTCL